ncbi:zinc-binding metallopeptidase family protein [Haloechinothrix halophila]|uniref:hypothetical protein n=1 Tax=Haloechinothrix halophila TaxID=1069073 RepID=UPI0004038638|nr:hypothetical protein [Haloechinothrix halophila]
MEHTLSRRGFLTGTAATLTITGIGLGSRPAGAFPLLGGLSPASSVDPSQLPSAGGFQREVHKMVRLGPRLPGTLAHDRFVDRLDAGFRTAGLSVTRDTHHFERWLAKDFALEVVAGSRAGAVDVASYYTYAGQTPPEGVVGPLAYLGPLPSLGITGNGTDIQTVAESLSDFTANLPDAVRGLIAAVPGGVADKIVVMDAVVPPLPLGAIYPLLTYAHDPDGTMSPAHDFKRMFTTLITLPVLTPFKEAGAAGVVFILDASPENARGQYTPFIHGYQDLPALLVDRVAGAGLRTAAADASTARLTLVASRTPDVPSDSLMAVLPGSGPRKDEVMIVHTHTDGQNAFEENAGIAQVALARYFARKKLDRTLVFSSVTGHFAAELPETHGFIHDHPEIIDRAVANLTLEHLGATEWLDNARGYYPTGLEEPAEIFHSLTPITASGIESLQATDLRRTLLLRAIGPFFFGVGAGLHAQGIPSLAYISAPNYLLALDGKNGHLDKFDAARMRQETLWSADVLHRLDQVDAALLRAGDAALYETLPLPAFPPEG